MNLIVKEMRCGVLAGAKAWAHNQREKLGELGSDLLYSMVKSEFLIMMQEQIDLHLQVLALKGDEDVMMEDLSDSGPIGELRKSIDSNYIKLVNFGKKDLTRFQDHYTSQVQHLFASLVQVDDLAQHLHNQRTSKFTESPSKVLKSYLNLIE